ncbi:hypothetical protein [Actinomadura terrae]|nr:hypothetical protein [Actinomadura terrae]
MLAISYEHPLVLGGAHTGADPALAGLDETAWHRHSCADGVKGRRWYE